MSRGTADEIQVKGDHLIGTAEVEEILGVPRSTISRWLREGRMPMPEAKPKASPIWKRVEIERFRDEREARAAAA